MSDLRTLLELAEPRDDSGFAPAPRVRAAADRRLRLRAGAVAAAMAAVLVAVPLAVRPGPVPAPPAGPATEPSATPTSLPQRSAGFAGTEWWVDLRASGITDDPVAAPTSRGVGMAAALGAVVLMDAGGGLRLRNGYAGIGPAPGGSWAAPGTGGPLAAGDQGRLAFVVPTVLDGWDLDPSCSRTSCPSGALPYWPGVEAFSRLPRVSTYELDRVGAGDYMPAAPTLRMTLRDGGGAVLLRLYLVAVDGQPVAAASP